MLKLEVKRQSQGYIISLDFGRFWIDLELEPKELMRYLKK